MKTKREHSDRGGEYTSDKHREEAAEEGVLQTFSGAHAPQQNSRAERKNRTLDEMISTVMHHANAPGSMWGEALNWVLFVENNTPFRKVDGVWMSRKALFTRQSKNFDPDKFRPFGVRMWGYLPVLARVGKKSHLRRKVVAGIFVGWANSGNGNVLRMWVPEERKIREFAFQHCTFQEDVYPWRDKRNWMPEQQNQPVDHVIPELGFHHLFVSC